VPGHGSDANVYPPMSTQLESLGIRLASPYAAENIPPDATWWSWGTRCRGGTRRRRRRSGAACPRCRCPRRSRVLHRGPAIGRRRGTHGKTTTTALAAWSLFALGADPSFLVGGVPKNFPVSYRLGRGGTS